MLYSSGVVLSVGKSVTLWSSKNTQKRISAFLEKCSALLSASDLKRHGPCAPALVLLPSAVALRACRIPDATIKSFLFPFFFFYLFFLLSWKFQRRTLLETSSKDRPYWWSLSSTKMTTGPFSKRHITREKCLRDPQQVGDIDALKGPRGERSCYWISPDSNITLAVVALLLLALDSMSVVLFFSSFLSFMKLLASMYRWACEGLVDCWRLSLLGFS